MTPTISVIVPTIGRESIHQTLASIECWPGDEVLVVGQAAIQPSSQIRHLPCPPGKDWGATERMLGMSEAKGDYLAFMDDDDTYIAGARVVMAEIIARNPRKPVLSRMVYPNGFVLWADPKLRCGNVSSQMILVPNEKAKLGTWTGRREGDFDFLSSMKWAPNEIVWNPDVIARLGHNDGFR